MVEAVWCIVSEYSIVDLYRVVMCFYITNELLKIIIFKNTDKLNVHPVFNYAHHLKG